VSALLHALLGLQRFEAFERALALLDVVEPDADTRRDRLARLYLHAGFLDSAHDEWAKLWNEGHDPRALSGISEVEAARGNQAAADELAEAARELSRPETFAARR
jgi:hypothetical protein